MNEATIERVAKHLAASNGDPSVWGAYAHQAMEVIELAEDQWEPIETAPQRVSGLVAKHDSLPVLARLRGGSWQVDRSECVLNNGDEPTHWRPLPKPPKT